jgi:hypothetical protein
MSEQMRMSNNGSSIAQQQQLAAAAAEARMQPLTMRHSTGGGVGGANSGMMAINNAFPQLQSPFRINIPGDGGGSGPGMVGPGLGPMAMAAGSRNGSANGAAPTPMSGGGGGGGNGASGGPLGSLMAQQAVATAVHSLAGGGGLDMMGVSAGQGLCINRMSSNSAETHTAIDGAAAAGAGLPPMAPLPTFGAIKPSALSGSMAGDGSAAGALAAGNWAQPSVGGGVSLGAMQQHELDAALINSLTAQQQAAVGALPLLWQEFV